MRDFHPLEVADRGSDKQLRMGENLNYFNFENWGVNYWPSVYDVCLTLSQDWLRVYLVWRCDSDFIDRHDVIVCQIYPYIIKQFSMDHWPTMWVHFGPTLDQHEPNI